MQQPYWLIIEGMQYKQDPIPCAPPKPSRIEKEFIVIISIVTAKAGWLIYGEVMGTGVVLFCLRTACYVGSIHDCIE